MLAFSLGLELSLTDEWQIGVEGPFGAVLPANGGKNRYGLGDVEFSTTYIFLTSADKNFRLGLSADVALPTGSRSKTIGGTGEWGVSLVSATRLTLNNGLKLVLHGQIGYEQQIRVSRDAREEAEEMGIGPRREKEFVFRGAVMFPFGNGKFVPSFEVVGRRILDATNPSEQGTIVELGGGFWWGPFKDDKDSYWEKLSLGVAVKAPVTAKKEGNYTVLFLVKFEFGKEGSE